jgi:hypothetical protein
MFFSLSKEQLYTYEMWRQHTNPFASKSPTLHSLTFIRNDTEDNEMIFGSLLHETRMFIRAPREKMSYLHLHQLQGERDSVLLWKMQQRQSRVRKSRKSEGKTPRVISLPSLRSLEKKHSCLWISLTFSLLFPRHNTVSLGGRCCVHWFIHVVSLSWIRDWKSTLNVLKADNNACVVTDSLSDSLSTGFKT